MFRVSPSAPLGSHPARLWWALQPGGEAEELCLHPRQPEEGWRQRDKAQPRGGTTLDCSTGEVAAWVEARSLPFGQNQRGRELLGPPQPAGWPRAPCQACHRQPSPALGLGRLAHPGISPIPVSPGAGGRRLSSVTGRLGRVAEQRALSSYGAEHTCPPWHGRPLPVPVPPGLGGTASTVPVPGRQQPRQPSRLPSRCGSRRRLHVRKEQSRHRRLVLPSIAPRCSRLPRAGGKVPLAAAVAPLGAPIPPPSPLSLLPGTPGASARRTIGRRSTEPPRPMDQKLQLQHSEKNVPRAARVAFCLLQIPEPDPFSLWV